MKLEKILLFLFVFIALVFSGCSFGTPKPPQKPKPIIKEKIVYVQKKVNPVDKEIETKKKELAFLNSTPVKEFVVIGEGIAPKNTISPAQAIALAKRAAVADAYRQLGEKLYGVKINSKETIKDAALSDSRIIAQVNGLIKDAYITENSYKNGLYRVKMELKLDSKTWKRIFSY